MLGRRNRVADRVCRTLIPSVCDTEHAAADCHDVAHSYFGDSPVRSVRHQHLRRPLEAFVDDDRAEEVPHVLRHAAGERLLHRDRDRPEPPRLSLDHTERVATEPERLRGAVRPLLEEPARREDDERVQADAPDEREGQLRLAAVVDDEPVGEEVVISLEYLDVERVLVARLPDAHDLLESRPRRDLAPPAVFAVHSVVLGRRRYHEVLRRIIRRVLIDVMDVVDLWVEEHIVAVRRDRPASKVRHEVLERNAVERSLRNEPMKRNAPASLIRAHAPSPGMRMKLHPVHDPILQFWFPRSPLADGPGIDVYERADRDLTKPLPPARRQESMIERRSNGAARRRRDEVRAPHTARPCVDERSESDKPVRSAHADLRRDPRIPLRLRSRQRVAAAMHVYKVPERRPE